MNVPAAARRTALGMASFADMLMTATVSAKNYSSSVDSRSVNVILVYGVGDDSSCVFGGSGSSASGSSSPENERSVGRGSAE